VPDEADTPMGRFQRGLESAHIDRSLTLQSDSYTSPDGVVIYRKRIGNRYRCRRAGGVIMPAGRDAAPARSPREAQAPTCDRLPQAGVDWKTRIPERLHRASSASCRPGRPGRPVAGIPAATSFLAAARLCRRTRTVRQSRAHAPSAWQAAARTACSAPDSSTGFIPLTRTLLLTLMHMTSCQAAWTLRGIGTGPRNLRAAVSHSPSSSGTRRAGWPGPASRPGPDCRYSKRIIVYIVLASNGRMLDRTRFRRGSRRTPELDQTAPSMGR
jgi:hypothetical protein